MHSVDPSRAVVFGVGRLVLALFLTMQIGGAGTVVWAAPVSNANQLSLAHSFPPDRLRQILIPRDQWHPFPAFPERARWQALPEPVKQRLLSLGEEALAKPLLPLPATQYLGYARRGNRSEFESAYFARRGLLQNLVLAECVEGKGRFVDGAADALWSICEESSWCLPAHVGVQKARVGLPDVLEPIVDLFAAESGVTVAWALYLLGSELDRVSPQVRRRAELELQRRLLAPVMERDDFGWMALNVTSPDRRPNNWTPWISASVLTVALLTESDGERRARLVHKLLRSIDGFLKFHPADGSCDEGPSYWGRAGGSLLDCLEVLHRATGGRLDVFSEPLVQEIGRFIYRAWIAGDYFVPIGDCPARFEPERSLVFRYGKRIGDPSLVSLARQGATVETLLGGNFLGRQIYAVFDAAEILAVAPPAPPLLRDVWLASDDLQLMTSRGRAGSTEGLYVAAWGGHNAQSHNHNDVGNFLVFADGQPVFVDVGAPTYTAQTFSSRRYEIWAFQSAYHNLPTINGVMQAAGREFAARNVNCETNDQAAQLVMDIAPAYPAAAKIKTWRRTVRLNRGHDVEITESFELAEHVGPTSVNFLTPLEIDSTRPGEMMLHLPEPRVGRKSNVRFEYDGAKLALQVERIELSDGRLKRSWGTHLQRLTLTPIKAELRDSWTVRVTQP